MMQSPTILFLLLILLLEHVERYPLLNFLPEAYASVGTKMPSRKNKIRTASDANHSSRFICRRVSRRSCHV